MNVPCPLQSATEDEPGAPALTAPGLTIDYAALNHLVAGTAGKLAAHGLRKGDRIAVCLENQWQTVVVMLAAIRAGAVFCPLSTRLPDREVAARSRVLGATCLVSHRRLEHGVEPDRLIGRGDAAGTPVPLDRPASIVFTSGSLGAARAALHTFGNHYFSASGSNRNIPLAPGDRWLLSLPLYHVGGMAIIFRCLLGRAAIALPDPAAPWVGHASTHASMVATQLQRVLLDGREGDLPRKAILLGGSTIPARLIDRTVELGLPVHTSYGLTETASQVTATAPEAGRDDLKTSGRTLPFRHLRIGDDGQILVRGETRFAGYVDGASLHRPFDEEGWFATGDLGRLDERERLTVLGRIDNLFVSGGENVLPEEIEAALAVDEDVERVVVVPVQDREYGMRPVAFVQSSGSVDEARLRHRIEAVLPRFMVPDAFHPWPSDARGEGLKADRTWLRRRAEALRAAR
jgi:O-succinylbenzoic acid--CoA ligase